MKRPRLPDLSKLRTYPIAKRRNLVKATDFGRLTDGRGAAALLNALPDILAGRKLRELIREIVRAKRAKATVAVAMGGHVVKTGVGPYLIDLIKRGVVTSVAMNGGASIHDLELSMIGETSEDVAAALQDGSFGMARETSEVYAAACDLAAKGRGLGGALGDLILRRKHPHAGLSILAACAKAQIPATVHLALGADITHMHGGLSGAEAGRATLVDFRILTGVVMGLEHGVWMNVGSAVVLPEVFLKAVSVARNLGCTLSEFTSVNLDMIQHYRPLQNVLARPRGKAIAITGHHEIMIPLIHAGVRASLSGVKIR